VDGVHPSSDVGLESGVPARGRDLLK